MPAENLILGEGRGFEIAQGRLGPGRIHHCMRTIGAAEAALEAMARRLRLARRLRQAHLAEQSVWEQRVAEARIDIEMTRLLCLKAADMMDKVGAKAAKLEIAMIKVARPAHRAEGASTTRSRPMAAPACPRISGWRGSTPTSAPCGWPTDRTRCTTARSPGWNSPATAMRGRAPREPEAGDAMSSRASSRSTRATGSTRRALSAWMAEHVAAFAAR